MSCPRWRTMMLALLLTAAIPGASHAQSPPVVAILAVLKDSILLGGEVTRIVTPPSRSYQRPPHKDALPALAALLRLPISRGKLKPIDCRWAPATPGRLGMDVTVTEFEMVGDSAKVSILRECRERIMGRISGFQSEPTYFLHRQDGRWVVVRTWMRVTVHPGERTQHVG